MSSDSGGGADLTPIVPPASWLAPLPDRSDWHPSSDSGGGADLTPIVPPASRLAPLPERSGWHPSAGLRRVSLRFVRRHPLQIVLLVLGVALGVAVVVATDLATGSARDSFRAAERSVAGNSNWRIVGGPAGVPLSLYVRLRVGAGLQTCAPVVEGFVTLLTVRGRVARHPVPVTPAVDGRPMRLLGVDPFAEAPFRNYLMDARGRLPARLLRPFLTEPGAVLVGPDFARVNGLVPGSRFIVESGAREIPLVVAGVVEPRGQLQRNLLSNMFICDVACAQEVLGMGPHLSHIDLRVDDPATLARIRGLLPVGVHLEPPQAGRAALERIAQAFEMNLTAISLLAIVVGMFLIYNTITFFVVQRRPLLGTLRALGATRGDIFGMVMSETLVLGAVGTLLGMILGVVLGEGAVRMVVRTLNDLYFTLEPSPLGLHVSSFARGAATGMGAAALSALAPAFEASRVAPAGVLQRSTLESRVSRMLPAVSAAAAVLVAGGFLAFHLPGKRLDVAFAGLSAILLGAACAVPIAVVVLMRLAAPLTGRLGGVVGRMAPRSIVRSLSRTAVAVAALMLAVSATVGVQIMVGSFRQTFEEWLDDTLTADVYVSTPFGTMSRNDGFNPRVADLVASVPGVARIATARSVTLETSRYGVVRVLALSGDNPRRRLVWPREHPPDLWRRMQAGAVLVSQPMALRYGISRPSAEVSRLPPGGSSPTEPGAVVILPTDHGPARFPVAGVCYDYGSEAGTVLMADAAYRRAWRDGYITSVAAWVAPPARLWGVIGRIRARLAGRYALVVRSNRGLREGALAVFERTFAITGALRGLVMVVAFIGILSSLMALQLERLREIGILRANGMTVRQVWGLVLAESGLIAAAAGVLALPVGWVLARILVDVIHPRSFGWTMAFIPRPDYFLGAVLLALGAGLLAGIYPALVFGRVAPAEAIRME